MISVVDSDVPGDVTLEDGSKFLNDGNATNAPVCAHVYGHVY